MDAKACRYHVNVRITGSEKLKCRTIRGFNKLLKTSAEACYIFSIDKDSIFIIHWNSPHYTSTAREEGFGNVGILAI